jgi:hypothetical protein
MRSSGAFTDEEKIEIVSCLLLLYGLASEAGLKFAYVYMT